MEERPYIKDRSWRARVRSFRDAFRGLGVLLATQINARVHAAVTLAAIAAGAWLGITRTEWLFVIGAIGLVWVAEAFNTALEFFVDLVSPQIDPRAGRIKDLAAGAVLAAALTAIAVGIMVFGPRLLALR